MGPKKGSMAPINLRCGCSNVPMTLLHGTQRVSCPHSGKGTEIAISTNSNSDVTNVGSRWVLGHPYNKCWKVGVITRLETD
jgi:hypothetical protein